jgi:aminoglycoside/choline kinase family phosphotransferase
MHERENALKEWLKKIISHDEFILTPLTGDASFRRYFRIQYNGLTQVVMDAPPGKEDLKPFVHVTNILTKADVCVPQLIAVDIEQGFLLLTDLGNTLLLNELRQDNADTYYKQAIHVLSQIQTYPIKDEAIPAFDKVFMLKEMNLCPEWFFKGYLALNLQEEECHLVQKTMDWIANQVAQQPIVFIHRDYHSRNLMVLPDKEHLELAVIDYQDAMYGPVTYDLVSLLKDCYISWSREQILTWVNHFYEHTPLAHIYTKDSFIRAFDLCGLQRHLKVLGIFSRLYLRDGKAGYLSDLPLTLKYVLECTETYEELHPFYNFLQTNVSLP